jgi:HEAT repeat protein
MSLSRRKPGKRLRNIAKHDPVVGVRRRAYGLLEKHFPELLDEEVARAQKYPRDIRWRLGLRINPDLAEALADAVEDTHASDEERARALRRLARIEPFRHFAKQVDIAFAEEGELRDAAVEVLSHADLADTPYAAFGESSLLVLTVIGSRAQKLSAITELGARGTERAIEPLLEFAAGFFVRRVLKQAAREAIAAIEKRTGIGRGFLSVAPVRGGELSQSDHADEGAVTIVEDPE